MMKPLRIGIAGFLLACATVAQAQESDVTGRIRVTGRPAGASVTTIVYAEPLDGRAPARPRRAKLVQHNKSFEPHVVALPAGSTVDFPNQDLIFHNVFSLSPPMPFDLGLYRAGASKSRVFAEPATYRVFCNIHPQMTAILLVLPTPFIADVDAAGAYKLAVPRGRYRVTVWSERGKPVSTEITVGAGGATVPELTLDESGYVELPHKNKYGQDYTSSAYDPTKDKKPR